MTSLEKEITEKIAVVIPKFEKLEVRASVDDKAYSIVFYATINGERFQNYEMADNGMVSEDKINRLTEEIAECIRCDKSNYVSGDLNKVFFDIVNDQNT